MNLEPLVLILIAQTDILHLLLSFLLIKPNKQWSFEFQLESNSEVFRCNQNLCFFISVYQEQENKRGVFTLSLSAGHTQLHSTFFRKGFICTAVNYKFLSQQQLSYINIIISCFKLLKTQKFQNLYGNCQCLLFFITLSFYLQFTFSI